MFDIDLFLNIIFNAYFERETERQRERERERERERIPNQLCRAEPDVGLDPTNHEIII